MSAVTSRTPMAGAGKHDLGIRKPMKFIARLTLRKEVDAAVHDLCVDSTLR